MARQMEEQAFKTLIESGDDYGEVIETSYRELMQRAEKISDPDWRQSFLENVVENKAVVGWWEKICQAEMSF